MVLTEGKKTPSLKRSSYKNNSHFHYINVMYTVYKRLALRFTFPLPKEFCADVGVPRRPCSALMGKLCVWLCWEAIPPSNDWDKDWDRELSGEADREEEECRDEQRAREPGMLTGSEPPNNL